MAKRNLTRRLGAYSVAAGAAALSMASPAEAGLKVFDHRAAPLYPMVDYGTWDQTLMLMNVKTGDFQYVVMTDSWDPESVTRYDQNGFVDTSPIPESAKTNETVWFGHRDVDVPWGKRGAGDGVSLETLTGGVSGQEAVNGIVYVPGRVDYDDPTTWVGHDWYWPDQKWDHDNDPLTADATAPLPLPADTAAGEPLPNIAIDGSLTYSDNSATGYTGVMSHGFGGLGYGSGSAFGYRHLTLGFKLEEADGTHYGWVAYDPGVDLDRVRVRSVFGWAYNTTPYAAAELTWEGDPSVPGDFDGDGDVDADDIDILCANMGSLDLATYDLDGSGVVDEADMIFHIETLVEYDTDGDGTPDGQGTHQGDFNLDGVVNATDLQLMKSSFGLSGVGYALGNANCDTVVNATDLQILKATFGLVASAVPEPATLTMLVLGACGLMARRRRSR